LDLWLPAEDGLRHILVQFQINEAQIDEIAEIFQGGMKASPLI
jgi:hypothetical protein